jgi:cytidine deaminase
LGALSESDIQVLTAAAKDASARAYCPYSRFPVGAAVRARDGAVFAGCNVENASYGLTVCAERNAMFSAVGAGATDLVALVVYTPTPSPVTPCGACRQVLIEFAPDADVICICTGPKRLTFKAAELLPNAFTL